MIWTELNSIIEKNHSFLISSHLSLDGDCVGSELAAHWYLQSLGKRSVIYNHDPLPHKFNFLDTGNVVGCLRPEEKFDVMLVLDCSNPARLGWEDYRDMAPVSVNIDHHRDNTRFADLNIVEKDSAATAMLLYRFFSDTGIDFPVSVAEALYAAIMTDTGGFRFSNTNAEVLSVCADLATRGARCSFIYQKAYDSHTPNGLLLWSRIWSTLGFDLDGKVCSMNLPLDLVQELGATYSDTEGMADFTVLAEGVEVGMFIKHRENEAHFSLRSRGKVDVGRIAQKIKGGGGHGSAAGCTIPLPYAQAKAQMLQTIAAELKKG